MRIVMDDTDRVPAHQQSTPRFRLPYPHKLENTTETTAYVLRSDLGMYRSKLLQRPKSAQKPS